MRTSSTARRQEDTRPAAEHEETEHDAGEGYPDMAKVCRILAGQVEALDAMFRHVRELAMQEDGETEAFERLSRLALRAQAQTARTAMVLSRLCPPPPPRIVEEEPDPYEEAFLRAVMGDPGLPPSPSMPPPLGATPVAMPTTQLKPPGQGSGSVRK